MATKKCYVNNNGIFNFTLDVAATTNKIWMNLLQRAKTKMDKNGYDDDVKCNDQKKAF